MKKLLGWHSLLLFLAACGSTNHLGIDDKFDPSNSDALLIVGLSNPRPISFGDSLYWRELDRSSQTFKGGAGFLSKLSVLHGDGTSYFIHRLPPGTYAIDFMAGTYAKVGYVDLKYHFRFRPTTLAVQIKAGEIVYAGDFEIAVWQGDGRKLERKFKHQGPNIPAVNERLKAYSNVKGNMVYREPEKVELKLPVEQ